MQNDAHSIGCQLRVQLYVRKPGGQRCLTGIYGELWSPTLVASVRDDSECHVCFALSMNTQLKGFSSVHVICTAIYVTF
jgi:hypothetical protein